MKDEFAETGKMLTIPKSFFKFMHDHKQMSVFFPQVDLQTLSHRSSQGKVRARSDLSYTTALQTATQY